VAGGGGVIYDPDEIRELVNSWGLGEETNNIAEALSLWQGLAQAWKLAINEITVIGDSQILIQAMVTNSSPNQMKLQKIFKKIQRLSNSFRKIEFFHVLRHLNDEADQATNATAPLIKGQSPSMGPCLSPPFCSGTWRVVSWKYRGRWHSDPPRALTCGNPSPSHRSDASPARWYFIPQLTSFRSLPHEPALTSLMQFCTEPIPLPHGARARPLRILASHARVADKSRGAACLQFISLW
jgi:ribonuclease HI